MVGSIFLQSQQGGKESCHGAGIPNIYLLFFDREGSTATPYFKPSNNQTTLKPNYFLHETDKWLVFPHELEGLSIDEIKKHKPELHDLIDKVVASKKND